MSALTDIWHAVHAIIFSADTITLVIGIVVVLAAGFMMETFNSIVSSTVLALIGFALLGFIRAVTLGKQDFTAYAHTDWHSFLAMPMLTLVAYVVLFGVLIAVVHFIRSAINR
ncbi:MAG: hypothetical protein WCA81_17295 [Rhizomicrobium sp.]